MVDRLAKSWRELRTIYTFLRVKRVTDALDLGAENTVADAVEASVDRRPTSAAVRFEGHSWSYAALDRQANRVASWAHGVGLGRGDVVALLMGNRPEYVFVWLGLAKAGIQTALINTNLTGGPLAHALSVSGARTLVVGAELAASYASAAGDLAEPPDVWVEGGDFAGHRLLDDALERASEERPPRSWRAGQTAGDNLFYIYTSGTTGLPKAARFSHFRFLQVGQIYSVLAGLRHDDVIYCVLPLYHTAGGVIAVAIALLNGATLVLRRKFSASAFWDDCRANRVTVFQYIGELCRYLVNRPPALDDRNHRVRCAIGNGLRPDVWEKFQPRFGIHDVLEFYGATEANFAIVNFDNKVGAVGRVPPYLKRVFPVEIVRFDVETERHVRGPDGFCQRCDPGEAGEAIGLIPNKEGHPIGRYEGYTDRSESEKKILRDVFTRGDAWYRTGDLLTCDEEGYFYFVDRIGDTFRWKGENVATGEVAAVLGQYDGILEANVYGVAVPGADGRAGMAALVADDGLDLTKLYAYASERLPAYARPLFLRMSRQMDTTGTFKHRKVDLVREGFDPSAVRDPVYFRDDTQRVYVPLDATLFERIASGEVAI